MVVATILGRYIGLDTVEFVFFPCCYAFCYCFWRAGDSFASVLDMLIGCLYCSSMIHTPSRSRFDSGIFIILLAELPISDLNDAGVETPRGFRRRYNTAKAKYLGLIRDGFLEAVVG